MVEPVYDEWGLKARIPPVRSRLPRVCMTQTSGENQNRGVDGSPAGLSVGIPLECRWERRGRDISTKMEIYPRLKVGDSTPLWLNGRFMTKGNGAEVTGMQRELGGGGDVPLGLKSALRGYVPPYHRPYSSVYPVSIVPRGYETSWGQFLHSTFDSFFRHRFLEFLILEPELIELYRTHYTYI